MIELKTSDKKIIEEGLLYNEASTAGFNERYKRGKTSHTIHVWWARRPHSSMRSLVFASLANSEKSNYNILQKLPFLTPHKDEQKIEKAREKIKASWNKRPKVLDMFSGGGTIPYEAALLGAKAYSVDANELAVFTQLSNLNYTQNFANETERYTLLKKTGEDILKKLKKETAWLYPARKRSSIFNDSESTFGYFWTYSYRCHTCDYKFYLIKRPWLSRKRGQEKAIITTQGKKEDSLSIKEVDRDKEIESVWVGTGKVKCPQCGKIHVNIEVSECEDELITVSNVKKVGKGFYLADADYMPGREKLKKAEKELLNKLNVDLPDSELPEWSGIVNPAIYGMRTHADFLNIRQRVLILYLIKNLRETFAELEATVGAKKALSIVGILSSLIDQLVDWNSRLSTWISQNEQVGRGFCGPGISMTWDYIETDPLQKGPANLWSKLNRILKGINSIPVFEKPPEISRADAQALPFKDNYFDSIITDPPYYDNIYYSILADFFYSWKKLLFDSIKLDLFSHDSTTFEKELVASSRRSEEGKAHEEYCQELSKAISEAYRVLKKGRQFSLIYSHSSLNGWEALLKAYRNSKFKMTSVEPMSIERKQRPRAMNSKAVNTCMVFVAQKQAEFSEKKKISWEDLNRKFIVGVEQFYEELNELGWEKNDASIACFAKVIGSLMNYSEIENLSTEDSLIRIENRIKEFCKEFKLSKRKSL